MNFGKILDRVNLPIDLKKLSIDEMEVLCDDIRKFMISTISQIGGHLGAGLGVVELSVALHYVFNAPHDKIIWDIGHQAYPHKILTGRKDRFHTIRQHEGLSGFCSIFESEYDVFGAGHSSTSISAGLGIATARDLKNENFHVVSVIGDSALTAGMAYEALNNAGHLNSKMVVILNDNDMSISPAVGSLRNYLAKVVVSNKYIKFRHLMKFVTKRFSDRGVRFIKNLEISLKDLITGSNIFEALGFYYIGPIDGHNLLDLISHLNKIKDIDVDKPILLHIKTEKGHGYAPAKIAHDKLHGVNKFDIETGVQVKSSQITYTDIFSQTLLHMAQWDSKIIAITAGMPSGTGLNKFAKAFPERFFDTAISEQHSVTFAAGLARSGMKPYCAIYSTFLQRAYDQIIHDVAIQKLPVKFAIDRAGFVGADGATHAGSFDIAFLSIIPNMIIMAPSSGFELVAMMKLANNINDKPCAFRYPRGEISESNMPDIESIGPCEIGKMKIISEKDSEIAIISYGTILKNVLKANDILLKEGINISIFDGRFAKPLDETMLDYIAKKYPKIITIEEGSSGGFASLVMNYFAKMRYDNTIAQMFMNDDFLEHSTIDAMYQKSGLSPEDVVSLVKNLQP